MKTTDRTGADLQQILKAVLEYIRKTNEIIGSLITVLEEPPEPAAPLEPAAPVIIQQTKEFISVKEAMEYIGFSRTTLYRLIENQKIPCYKPSGGRIFFKKGELDALISRGKKKAGYEIMEEVAEIVNGIKRRGK
jgi:excisionase family DNA binding protein